MKKLTSRTGLAALGGSVALLLGALQPAAHAQQIDVYGMPAGTFPFWDNANPFVWSLGAPPTATQDAYFPAAPGTNTTTPSFRPDGTQVGISNFNPLNPNPVANNVFIFGNYQFVSVYAAPLFPTPSTLTLNQGNVFVNDQSSAYFAVNIAVSSGLLNKWGPGSMFIGPGTIVTGSVRIAQGSFGGAGYVTGNLTNHAVLAQAGMGELHIGGNFTQMHGGTLTIGVAGPSSADQLGVGGTAKLGGNLNVSVAGGFVPRAGEKYQIIYANRVSGTFENVDAPTWDFLTLRPIYGSRNVNLQVVVSSFEALPGLTPNQQSVGRAVDRVLNDPRESDLVNYLYTRRLDRLPHQLDRIAPEELASIFTMGVALEQVQSTNLQRRTDDIRNGARGFSAGNLAINGDNPSYSGGINFRTGTTGPSGNDGKEVKESKQVTPAEDRWGAFLSGTGEWVSVGNTDNARGYNLDSGGFTLGIDYKVTPNFAIGLAAGYTGTTADLTENGRVWVNGGKLGVYATFFQNQPAPAPAPAMSKDSSKDSSKEAPAPAATGGGLYADLAAFGGYNSYDTRRSAVQGQARGDTDGGEVNALFGAGYDFKAGGLTFGPTASFNYTYVGMNGFTEHGSLAPLDVHGSKGESLRTAFGLKASYDWKVGGIVIKPELRAAWQHEYGDTAYGLDSSFGSGAGDAFHVAGARIGRDSALLGAGFAIQCSDRCATYFYYDGELGRKNYQSTAVTGGLRLAF
jgi:outer membrane autotransporter protein